MPNSEVLNASQVRNGTWGSVWLNGELVCECYGAQFVPKKDKEAISRCRTMAKGHKATAYEYVGSLRLYNATSRLIELEAEAMRQGRDLHHTIITDLSDPDNPKNQRIAIYGVSFDNLTLADWEAAKLGTIEAPFTAEDFETIDT